MINFLRTVFSGTGVVVDAPSTVKVFQMNDNQRGQYLGEYSTVNNQFYKVLPTGIYELEIKTGENIRNSKNSYLRSRRSLHQDLNLTFFNRRQHFLPRRPSMNLHTAPIKK